MGKIENIQKLKSSNFKIINHDIIKPLNIEEDIDEIYNMASIASPLHYQLNPIYTFKTNIIGMLNLLELANKKDSKILQSSTSEVYGEPLNHPQTESYNGNVNPIGVRACYDESKRAAETLCFDFNREHNTKIKVVRIFNTYGKNMSITDGRVITNFIVQALTNKDITIYGNGSQTRSFCYIDDMINGLYSMMNSDNDFLGVVNLGNPKECSILELANKILNKIDTDSQIVYYPSLSDDPTKRNPDISLAMEKLNWKPKIQLNEGLDKTIKYYSNLLEGGYYK